MNVNNINPQSIFGGSWQKIEGRFLLGSSSSYSLGTTGGEANHTLTINEMPSHNHVQHHELKYANTSWWIAGSGGTTIEVGDFNTSNTGGNQPHNNLPPYLVVNIWKRVA